MKINSSLNYFAIFSIIFTFTFCSVPEKQNEAFSILQEENFDTIIDNKPVKLFTLENEEITVFVTNYGARIVGILAPDKQGNVEDISLGYASISDYTKDGMFLGTMVGPYANRIGDATFTLDSLTYNLENNDNGNTLHSGSTGFQQVVWDVEQEGDSLLFSYTHPHLLGGFPGPVHVDMIYSLNDENELIIDMKATSERPTVINLTNHAYFNLKGEAGGDILDHVLMINADSTTPVNEALIPTGEVVSVLNSPFDFTSPKRIGDEINAEHQQLIYGRGYDHNWVLNERNTDEPLLAARLSEPVSGRVLEVYTTEPGIQFYSGNFMDGTVKGKYGNALNYREALALEPQNFPDSPNQPFFPDAVLKPGEEYHHTIIFKFDVEE